MKQQAVFKISVVAAALLAVYGQVRAGEGEDLVKELTRPDSSISFGASNLSGNNQQLGRYDGLAKKGSNGILDLSVRKRDEDTGTWMSLTGSRLGLDSRELKGTYEVQGNWGIGLDYSETPSRDPKTYMTGVQGIGSNRLQYGTVMGVALAAGTANAYQAALYPATNEVHLGTKRENTTLTGMKYLMPDLAFNFSFKNEDKKGTQIGSRGVNPEFFVTPIDWNTKQADASLSYVGKALQLTGGLSASWFSNSNKFVNTVGGSQNTVAGANYTGGQIVISTPLNNSAFQYFLDGGYTFSKDVRGTFKASRTRAKQNDDLSAYTNAVNATGATGTSGIWAGAPTRLNGLVDTTTYNLALTARPMDKLSLVVKYDYNDRKDKTPETTVGVSGATTVTDNPHGFKKEVLKLEGTYRLPEGYSLTAGGDREKRTHQLSYANDGSFEETVKLRATTDETTWRLQMRKAMSETINGSVAYLSSKRTGSSWNNAVTEVTAIANQLGVPYTDVSATTVNWTNPFAFADRKRDKWRFTADWAPAEGASLQFNYEQSKDKYTESKAGLQSGKGQLFSVDGSLALSKDWSLTGFASQDSSSAHHLGITYDPRTTNTSLLRDSTGAIIATSPALLGWLCSSANVGAGQCTTDLTWDMNMKDTNNTIGIGLKGKIASKWTVGGNFNWSEAKSTYPETSNVPTYNVNANGAYNTTRSKQGMPDIKTTTTKLTLFGEYAMEKDTDVRVTMIHQRWTTNDWTWMQWNAAGTGMQALTFMDGTQVVQNQSQRSTFLGVSVNYKFQ